MLHAAVACANANPTESSNHTTAPVPPTPASVPDEWAAARRRTTPPDRIGTAPTLLTRLRFYVGVSLVVASAMLFTLGAKLWPLAVQMQRRGYDLEPGKELYGLAIAAIVLAIAGLLTVPKKSIWPRINYKELSAPRATLLTLLAIVKAGFTLWLICIFDLFVFFSVGQVSKSWNNNASSTPTYTSGSAPENSLSDKPPAAAQGDESTNIPPTQIGIERSQTSTTEDPQEKAAEDPQTSATEDPRSRHISAEDWEASNAVFRQFGNTFPQNQTASADWKNWGPDSLTTIELPRLGLVVFSEGSPSFGHRFGLQQLGVEVQKVLPGGPADEAGIQGGDMLVFLTGYVIQSAEDVRAQLVRYPRGSLPVTLLRRSGSNSEAVAREVRIWVLPQSAVP